MKNLKIAFVLSVASSLLSPGSLFAENQNETSISEETAKVIFVRGSETAKTRSLKYNVYIGQEYVGRMKVNDTKEIVIAPGNYNVQSNFYKGTALPVNIEAGKTYVISTEMQKVVNGKKTSFKLVSEELAANDDNLENTES